MSHCLFFYLFKFDSFWTVKLLLILIHRNIFYGFRKKKKFQ